MSDKNIYQAPQPPLEQWDTVNWSHGEAWTGGMSSRAAIFLSLAVIVLLAAITLIWSR